MSNGRSPAYPCPEGEWVDGVFREPMPGMTKREAFAMAAMQGLLANPEDGGCSYQRTAEMSVAQADALLAELERTEASS